jgi:hypothetical protein
MRKNSILCVLALLAFIVHGFAQPPVGKHEADFTLTISIVKGALRPHTEGRKVVLVAVVEKNISTQTISTSRLSDEDTWYAMTVLRDGNAVPFTEEYKRSHSRDNRDPNRPIAFSPYIGTLKPGETQTFEVLLSEIYDLSMPGTYAITFSRGTDPGQPDNVDVKSNTITITLLPGDDPPSTQP